MDIRSKLGYKRNSPFAEEPFNYIKSNHITMKEVDKNLLLFPKDNKGKYNNPILATPGNDYLFPGYSGVLEIPFLQQGGQPRQTPEEWKDFNIKKGFVASPGSSVNLSGNQSNKYMEFYDPTMYQPSDPNATTSSEINWKKINDPNWKYTDQNNSPFVSYSQPNMPVTNKKQFVQPTNERSAIGFQPNYTTYKYNDGSIKYQDTKGNLYNNTEELQSYLEGLVKMKDGGSLNKFVANYAKKQINLSQAPQGQSMDDFLTTKNMEFIDFISENTNKVLQSEAKKEFKKFQMGGPQVNFDNPQDPLQPRQPQAPNNFYTQGPFGSYGQQNTPQYVDQYTQQYNFPTISNPVDSGLNLTPDVKPKTLGDNSIRNERFADIAMFAAQGINGLFNRGQARNQENINEEKMAIYNTATLQYGSRGDYDVNSGVFRPNQYTPTSYKKGGEYSVDHSNLGDLLSQGFEFEIID